MFTEKSDFQEGVHQKPINMGELPKRRRGVRQFADLQWDLAKKREVDTPMQTMFYQLVPMLLPIEIASFICTNSCVLCLICKDGKFK